MVYADDEYDDDTGVVDMPVELRGAPLAFLQQAESYRGQLIKHEILISGPGGTGKSRGFMQVLAFMVEQNPEMRVLLTRATRESMTESTLVQWERCWPEGHPILEGPAREGRSVYHHPNGSTVAAIGLDKPGKLFSTEWDAVYGEELTGDGTANSDVSERTWGLFLRGLRGNHPYKGQHFLIGTCNPSYPDHWVKRRIDKALYAGGTMIDRDPMGGEYWLTNWATQLADNPVYHSGKLLADGKYDPAGWTAEGKAYISGLRRIPSEHDRRRLLDGEWCVAEGRAFPDFDRGLHIVDGHVDRSEWIHSLVLKGQEPVDIEWYLLSMDFGYRKPGVAQVWAVDGKMRMFRVAEVYESERQLDWWAEKLTYLAKMYPIAAGVGDSAEPRTIDFLNSRMGWVRGRESGALIRPADKTRGKIFGFDQIRWGFSTIDGGPRMFLLRDAHPFGKDSELTRRGKPACFEDELDRAIWRRARTENDGTRNKEDLDPSCEDHAIDAAAYGSVFAWNKDLGSIRPPTAKYKPNQIGAFAGWPGGRSFDEWWEAQVV